MHLRGGGGISRQTDENKEAFNRMPGSFLERLAELLSMPQQGCDVLAPNTGVSSPEWLEFNCRVLPTSVAGVDADVSPLDGRGCLLTIWIEDFRISLLGAR